MSASPDHHAQRLALALTCQARLLSTPRLHEAAGALATELATALGLRHVAVARVHRGSARVIAVSHLAEQDSTQSADAIATAALDEAIDQNATVCFPPTPDAPLQITHAHAQLVRIRGGWACSMPLTADETIVGALLVESDSGVPMSAEDIELLETVGALAGPVLAMRAADSAPLPRRVMRALRPHPMPGHPLRNLALGSATALVLAALFVPLPYNITADARIEGEIQRAMVAPADGYIQHANVRPGDTVRAGQVLVTLADRELLLERRKLESELAQHENAFASALSLKDRGQLVVQQARASEARARIELIDHRLDRGLIRAPMESVVLTGDLDQAQGAPVARGEVLLVLAPRDRYRLMIEVDERDVAELTVGAPGRVALTALASESIDFTVTRILPTATARDGRHFVEVEAQLDTPPAAVHPGMRGYARIAAGRLPLAAQWSVRVRDWLKLQLWRAFGV